MRFFAVLDFQHEILAIFLGLVSALLIYLALRSFRYSQERKDEKGAKEQEFYESIGVRIKNHPVPPFLLFLILGFIIWFFFYVIIFGVKGGPI
jgi:membrane protein DedA with SNARE-associated domain